MKLKDYRGMVGLSVKDAALQSGAVGHQPVEPNPGVVSAHWGEVIVRGSAHFPKPSEMPVQSALAPVTGQAYDEMGPRADRWLTIRIGGEAFFATLPLEAWPDVPLNIHAHQEPIPGVKVDQWDYASLKRVAMQFGQVYGIDREGLLYPGGVVQPG